MANMYTKFDEEAHNGLVSILFTNLFPYLSIVTLTFDLWPPKSIGSTLSLWLLCTVNLVIFAVDYFLAIMRVFF